MRLVDSYGKRFYLYRKRNLISTMYDSALHAKHCFTAITSIDYTSSSLFLSDYYYMYPKMMPSIGLGYSYLLRNLREPLQGYCYIHPYVLYMTLSTYSYTHALLTNYKTKDESMMSFCRQLEESLPMHEAMLTNSYERMHAYITSPFSRLARVRPDLIGLIDWLPNKSTMLLDTPNREAFHKQLQVSIVSAMNSPYAFFNEDLTFEGLEYNRKVYHRWHRFKELKRPFMLDKRFTIFHQNAPTSRSRASRWGDEWCRHF